VARWAGCRRVSCFYQIFQGEAPAWRPLDPEFADDAGRSLPGILIALAFAFAVVVGFVIGSLRTAGLSSPAARAAFENVAVVQKTIQHGGDGGAIAEQLPQSSTGSVRCNQRAGRS